MHPVDNFADCLHAAVTDMVDFLDTYPEPLTPPPPGGVAPNDRGTAFIVIVLLTFVIAMTFGGIRIYTKAFITRALGWDDCTSRDGSMRHAATLTVTS